MLTATEASTGLMQGLQPLGGSSVNPAPTYPVVLLDPPWMYHGSPTKWAAAGKEYTLMEDQDIYDLDIPIAKPGVLFCWATGPMIHKAVSAIAHWGLHYRGMAFVWVKTTQKGEPYKARGVRPSIVKPLTEFVLAASTEKYGRPLPLASESVVQTILAPVGRHSAKPAEVTQRIDTLYPELPKLEMFARGGPAGPNWSVWGHEAEEVASDAQV